MSSGRPAWCLSRKAIEIAVQLNRTPCTTHSTATESKTVTRKNVRTRVHFPLFSSLECSSHQKGRNRNNKIDPYFKPLEPSKGIGSANSTENISNCFCSQGCSCHQADPLGAHGTVMLNAWLTSVERERGRESRKPGRADGVRARGG